MSDNLIMAEGRGTTTPRLEIFFNGGSPHNNRSNPHYLHEDTGDSLTKARPDAPLKIGPYRLTPGPWYACIDSYTERSFGGRYTAREVDHIAAHFRDWPRAISPGQFELVAEVAIAASRVEQLNLLGGAQ